ncbi:MAG: hypothetical protein ACK5SF_10830 [Hyphomonadaceae bacterium]|jgi:hypothetical protein|nr:hypothetical protein [Aquidulcibacter sp.]
MSEAALWLNSFQAFAQLSVSISVLCFIAALGAIWSSFESRALNFLINTRKLTNCRLSELESIPENRTKLRMAYSEVQTLRHLGLFIIFLIFCIGYSLYGSDKNYLLLAGMILFVGGTSAYRNSLDQRLKGMNV